MGQLPKFNTENEDKALYYAQNLGTICPINLEVSFLKYLDLNCFHELVQYLFVCL
jgi:hypothetical protein